MKKIIKILPILMTVMMVFMAVSPVLADRNPFDDGTYKPNTNPTQAGQLQTAGQNILGIIQIIGNIAAVGILMVVGIKYMMGSAEQKAEYKKVMIPYIVGAVLLFAAVNVAKVVWSFTSTVVR